MTSKQVRRVDKLLVMKGSRRVYKLTSKQVACYKGKLVLMLLCLSLQATCSLVYLFTCPLTMLLYLSLQATGWLVYLFTCPLTMLLCLLFTLSTSNLFTRLLVDLSTYLLVYFSTKKLHNLAFSINFAIFANCLIHMYHMFVEIIDILYYEFKL